MTPSTSVSMPASPASRSILEPIARHITIEDVHDIAHVLRSYPSVEFNIEGDPRPGLLDLVKEVRPQQCTLVPVVPGEITSQVGWTRGPQTETLADVVSGLKDEGIRVSLFVAPDLEAVRFAASVHGDRMELYTEPYAQAFSRDPESGRRSFETYAEAAELAASLGLGVNAGHDLDLRTCACSASCHTSRRCRSATP